MTEKRQVKAVWAVCAALMALTLFGPVPSALALDGEDPLGIAIEVAPRILNMKSHGSTVTVHTDIAYSDVAAETVTLNGLPIHAWKADNQGNFVAKFTMAEVKALVEEEVPEFPAKYEMTLAGETTEGIVFEGAQTILVIDRSGGKGGT